VSIAAINAWHQAARPEPTEADLRVQIGVHVEEVAEFLDSLIGLNPDGETALSGARALMHLLADRIKSGHYDVTIGNRKEALDAICDQIVTAVGVGHCAGFKTVEAISRVDESNWTKTVNGEFLRDANGKIVKPTTYCAPNLEGMY
jgi:hypothetical protein